MTTDLKEFSVSYAGSEANTIFMEPVFMDEDILNSFRVVPNVVNKKKLQFADHMEKILQRHVSCAPSPKGKFNVYGREVSTERIRFNVELCWEDFADTIIEELLNKGLRISDMTGTVIQSILIDRIKLAVKKDINRLYYFGDMDGGDVDYDLMDGFWTVHAPEIVAADLAPYFNSGSGTALTAGQGIDKIKTVYDNQPLALKALPETMKTIQVSETVYTQYMEDIEDGGGGDFGLMAMINGMKTPTFRGLPVVPKYEWNRYYDDDLGNTLSHLILLTTKQNLVVATDLLNDVANMDIWYDRDSEKIKVRGAFKLGCNYVHAQLFSFGY